MLCCLRGVSRPVTGMEIVTLILGGPAKEGCPDYCSGPAGAGLQGGSWGSELVAGVDFITSAHPLRGSARASCSWVARGGRSLTRGTARSLELFGGDVGAGVRRSSLRWAAGSAPVGLCVVLQPPPATWKLASPLLRAASPRPGAPSLFFLPSFPLGEPCCPFPPPPVSGPRFWLPYLSLLP